MSSSTSSSSERSGRRFLLKLGVHLVTLPLAYLAAYAVIADALQWVRTRHDPEALYVLGDSRVVHGLDIETLAVRLGRPVHNYAVHGMSVYNLYAIAELLPDESTVLLSPSLGMFMRDRDRVTYESTLSVRAMWEMLKLGYEPWYYWRILEMNRSPVGLKHHVTNREAYPVTEAPDLVKTVRFQKIYQGQAEPPPRFYRNEALFARVIELLEAKSCDVRIVEFPVTPELRRMRETSVFGTLVDEIDVLSREDLKLYAEVTLRDPEGRNIFYDMDHLNVIGRALITEWLAEHVFADRRR